MTEKRTIPKRNTKTWRNLWRKANVVKSQNCNETVCKRICAMQRSNVIRSGGRIMLVLVTGLFSPGAPACNDDDTDDDDDDDDDYHGGLN